MRRMLAVALVAALAAAVLGPRHAGAIAEADGRTRVSDAAALGRLFAGQTFYGRYADNTAFVEYYAADGRLAYWDGCPHAGRWWIDPAGGEAVACFFYPTMAPNGPHCFDVFRAAAGRGGRLEFLLVGSGPSWPAHAYTRAIRPGNPEQLSLTASGCQVSRAAGKEPRG